MTSLELASRLPDDHFAAVAGHLDDAHIVRWLSAARDSGRTVSLPDAVVADLAARCDPDTVATLAHLDGLSARQQVLVSRRGSTRVATALARRGDLGAEAAAAIIALGRTKLTAQVWHSAAPAARARVLGGLPLPGRRKPVPIDRSIYRLEPDPQVLAQAARTGELGKQQLRGLVGVLGRLPAGLQRDVLVQALDGESGAGLTAFEGGAADGVRDDIRQMVAATRSALRASRVSTASAGEHPLLAELATALGALPDEPDTSVQLDLTSWLLGAPGQLSAEALGEPLPASVPPRSTLRDDRAVELLQQHPGPVPASWVLWWLSVTYGQVDAPATFTPQLTAAALSAAAARADVWERAFRQGLVELDVLAATFRPAVRLLTATLQIPGASARLWSRISAAMAPVALDLLDGWDGTFDELAATLAGLEAPGAGS